MIEQLYNYKTYDYEKIRTADNVKRRRGNQGTKKRLDYKDLICAFDIETTRIDDENSILYHWQAQIGDDTITGRSWKECGRFFHRIARACGDSWLVLWVHNLSFEFQFLRNIYGFEADEVFAVDSRRILKCDMLEHLEFRCSYLHSNMSLDEYTEKMGVEHRKLSGAVFDYEKVRYPWTPLSGYELDYCINDVRGLVEAVKIEMEHDGDTLQTVPLTSTGYVRRDVKRAMRELPHYYVRDMLPDWDTYIMLREAFRGGNTHANRHYAGQILHGVKSADISSSYPAAECCNRFPVSAFRQMHDPTVEDLRRLVFVRKRAVLVRLALWDVRLSSKDWGCPYIPIAKCRRLVNAAEDNGRVLRADYLEITMTDIDLKIVLSEYSYSNMQVLDLRHARYGWLPDVLVHTIITYYQKKTTLKGVDGQEIYYTKNKNKLNSIYGMSAQNPVKLSIIYDPEAETSFSLENKDPREILEESNRKAFFPYQWGVWCTAIARYRLEEGLRLAHAGRNAFIYCDTDSVKYIGDIDWNAYNAERIADSEDAGAYADDPKGCRHYMGVYEYEGEYIEFATRGAKKYAYSIEGRGGDPELHITIAGVNKKKGADELRASGGLKAFLQDRFIFRDGETEAVYNDRADTWRYVDGHRLHVGPSVTIRPSTKTLSDTDDYMELLEDPDAFERFMNDYNLLLDN